jgi:hypothetical protein
MAYQNSSRRFFVKQFFSFVSWRVEVLSGLAEDDQDGAVASGSALHMYNLLAAGWFMRFPLALRLYQSLLEQSNVSKGVIPLSIDTRPEPLASL